MKKLILIILIFGAINITKGQYSIPFRKNVFKVNILPPVLSATSEISYERFLKPNLSVVGGIGANLKVDRTDNFELVDNVDLVFLNANIKNRYFLLEARHYFDICKCSGPPYSFYAGGFMRYNNINYNSNLQFFEDNNTSVNTNINVELNSYNLGVLLGYQLNLKNWRIDFEFLGLGYGNNSLQFEAESTLTNDELGRLSDALNGNFGINQNFKGIQLKSSNAEVDFWSWTVRYAASVGYSF